MRKWTKLVTMGLTLGILGSVASEKAWLRATSRKAEAYHRAVRVAAETVPDRIGTWFSQNIGIPMAAVSMLHPNVAVSRRYTEVQTGRAVSILIIHCTDARDLLGHYPPVCYPSHGWKPVAWSTADWHVDDLTVHGMLYVFKTWRADRDEQVAISNFFVLPDGRTCRDMNELDSIAQNRHKRYFGAAQIQLVADITLPSEQREEFLEQFLRSSRQFIDTVLRGVNYE